MSTFIYGEKLCEALICFDLAETTRREVDGLNADGAHDFGEGSSCYIGVLRVGVSLKAPGAEVVSAEERFRVREGREADRALEQLGKR